MLPPMGSTSYSDIKLSLRSLCLEDPRPWLVGCRTVCPAHCDAANSLVEIGSWTRKDSANPK